jgi:ParB/RepB/Spo0J family partition protein
MKKTISIPLSDIVPDPKNPRQDFEPKKLSELETSIKANGILNPLVVEETNKTDNYLLVDGERRYRAAKHLGLKEVPVTIMESMSDAERLVKRFHLQEQHSNWNEYEKSVAISQLAKESTENISDLAKMLGISGSLASNYILVSSLSKRTAVMAREKKLPFGWLVQIASTLKLVDDKGLSSDLEAALFDKIDNKVISSARDMRKYRISIATVGDKIVKKIIEDPKYSPTKATADAGTENIVDYEILSKITSTMTMAMERILIRKTKVIPTRIHNRIASLKKFADKMVDLDHEDDTTNRNGVGRGDNGRWKNGKE